MTRPSSAPSAPFSPPRRPRWRSAALFAALSSVAILVVGCESTKNFTTTVELAQLERFEDERGIVTLGLELRYSECPGDARRVLRADAAFAACATDLKVGDTLSADLVSKWQFDTGLYRTEVVRLGGCPLKQDRADPANYEVVETCKDIFATGALIGVRCDRTRNEELVAKCPWLRRR